MKTFWDVLGTLATFAWLVTAVATATGAPVGQVVVLGLLVAGLGCTALAYVVLGRDEHERRRRERLR